MRTKRGSRYASIKKQKICSSASAATSLPAFRKIAWSFFRCAVASGWNVAMFARFTAMRSDPRGLSRKTTEFAGDLCNSACDRRGRQNMVNDASVDGRCRHSGMFCTIGFLSDDDATMLPKLSKSSRSIRVNAGENDRNASVVASRQGFEQHRKDIRESPEF